MMGARDAALAPIVAEHTARVTQALRGVHHGLSARIRKVYEEAQRATKAAATAPQPLSQTPQAAQLQTELYAMQQDQQSDVAPLVTAMVGLYTAAWTAGAGAALTHDLLAGGSAPDLTDRMRQNAATKATQLADAQMANAAQAATDGLQAGATPDEVASKVEQVVNDPTQAAEVAQERAVFAAEAAIRSVYNQAGVAQWRWVVDGPRACPACMAKGAGGPYGPADDSPPLHANCGCGSEPVSLRETP